MLLDVMSTSRGWPPHRPLSVTAVGEGVRAAVFTEKCQSLALPAGALLFQCDL
jgi:hypothetical protein